MFDPQIHPPTTAQAADRERTAAPGYFATRTFAGEGDVRLHALVRGDPRQRAVVLLHGFPDFSLTWRHVLDDLAKAGYYAVALDLRGAGCSSVPSAPTAYHPDRHVADLVAVLATLTGGTTDAPERPHVVAHDYGASIGWLAAMRHPCPLASLAVLNGVHPAHVRTVGASPSRMLALAHAGILQVPGLAETLLTPDALTKVLSTRIQTGCFTARDAVRYRATFARPGVRRAMFEWYRQLARATLCPPRVAPKPIEGLPVLTLLGRSDPFLDAGLVAPPPTWVVHPTPTNVVVEGGHWLHWDQPRESVARLLAHLQRVP